ncbi:MAG: aldo/keto reductase [Opitutales bacterium]
METRTLGRSSPQITRVGFGAWALGGKSYGPVEAETAKATLRDYLKRGGNFIDTARGYATSEGLIGEVLQEGAYRRADVVIASKSPKTDLDGLRADLETTLRELQTDYVDLYYLHSPPEAPKAIETALNAMATLKAEGLIRNVGASVKGPNVTQDTVHLCRAYIHSGRCDALQVIYSIFRPKNAEMFAEAAENSVSIIVRTLLENGFLGGRYRPGHRFAESDHRHRWAGEKLDAILNEAVEVSTSNPGKLPLVQLAVRYVLDHPHVTAIIPGGKSPAQLEPIFTAERAPALEPAYRNSLIERYSGQETRFNVAD